MRKSIQPILRIRSKSALSHSYNKENRPSSSTKKELKVNNDEK